MKKIIISLFIFICGLFILSSCNKNDDTKIISTSYAGYDFARGVAKDNKKCGMLLNPGEELHDYSPSINDIERIINSEIFIYIGGESDSIWVEKQILPEIDKSKTKVISMMDVISKKGNVYDEENPESSISSESEDEEEEELDEHVWNSITNAKLIVEAVYEALIEIDEVNMASYLYNKDVYIDSLNKVDTKIKDTISSAKKDLLIFADRFPLLYFVKEYNLKYDAAFKGCETAHEANPKTIEALTKKVIENDINVVFVIELSESNIADTVIKTCKNDGKDVKKLVFYTMHNISKEDYANGLTYIDFMNKNVESLSEALN